MRRERAKVGSILRKALPPRRIVLEGLAVVLGATALCVLVTWPMAQPSVMSTTVPWDGTDPRYFTWQLQWVSHALWSDPFGVWAKG